MSARAVFEAATLARLPVVGPLGSYVWVGLRDLAAAVHELIRTRPQRRGYYLGAATLPECRYSTLEQPAIEALALLDAVRFGAPGQASERLTRLAGSLDLPTVSTIARLAAALRSGGAASELDDAARALGARTTLLAPTGLDSVLTSREFQVATLAAAGHASATIATRLGLSPRTVNNYLGRVYHKFGINRRTQLATVLAGAAAVATAEL